MATKTKTPKEAALKSSNGEELRVDRAADDMVAFKFQCTTIKMTPERARQSFANLETVAAFGSDVWMEEHDDAGQVFAMSIADGRFKAGRNPDGPELDVPVATFKRALDARTKTTPTPNPQEGQAME